MFLPTIWYATASYPEVEKAEDKDKGKCTLCGYRNNESRVGRHHIRQDYWSSGGSVKRVPLLTTQSINTRDGLRTRSSVKESCIRQIKNYLENFVTTWAEEPFRPLGNAFL